MISIQVKHAAYYFLKNHATQSWIVSRLQNGNIGISKLNTDYMTYDYGHEDQLKVFIQY